MTALSPSITELPAKIIEMTDGFALIDIHTLGTWRWPKSHLPSGVGVGSEVFVSVRADVMQQKYDTMRRLLEELIN